MKSSRNNINNKSVQKERVIYIQNAHQGPLGSNEQWQIGLPLLTQHTFFLHPSSFLLLPLLMFWVLLDNKLDKPTQHQAPPPHGKIINSLLAENERIVWGGIINQCVASICNGTCKSCPRERREANGYKLKQKWCLHLWKSLFYSGDDQLLVAQKGCAVSFLGYIQMLSGYGPG